MKPYNTINRSDRSKYLYYQLSDVIDEITIIDLSLAITVQEEIDFGTIPVEEKDFTIINSLIIPESKIMVQLAYVAPTGKELDELEFDLFDFRAVAGTGSFTLHARSLEGYVADKFVINYSFSKS